MSKSKLGPSSRADYVLVLISHIPMIETRLDEIRAAVSSQGKLGAFFKSNLGKDLMSTAHQNIVARQSNSKLSKPSKDVRNELSKYMPALQSILHILDYVVFWCRATKNIIYGIVNNGTDFDVRFNNAVVLHVSNLFVTFSKVTIFLYLHPICEKIVQCLPTILDLEKFGLSLPFEELYKFVVQATKNPFAYTHLQMSIISERLSMLCAQISPFLIQSFEYWPIIDWSKLSPFEKVEEKQENTLPPTINIVLQNLTLFRDLAITFLLIFPEYPAKNPQYATLMNSVLSEVSAICITPLVRLPVENLIEIFTKLTKNKEIIALFESNAYERELKNEVSHKQRLVHAYSLLSDICDISSFNPEYLPKLINEIMPLAALGEYEVSTALVSDLMMKEVSDMVNCLVDLGNLFCVHEDLIRRFFLYNLTTLDATFLKNMLKTISQLTDDWQIKMAKLIQELVTALETIDIEEFDSGVRYDLTPLIVTSNRLFYLFNKMSVTNQAAFLHPVFEHLSTIVMHAEIAQSPRKFFVKFCPIHKFWRFLEEIKKYMTNMPGGIQANSGFITLFQFFNYDEIELLSSQSAIKKAMETLTEIREKVNIDIKTIITDYLNPKTPLMRIANQSNLNKIFKPEEFMFTTGEFKRKKINTLIEFEENYLQIGNFITHAPTAVNLFGNEIKFLNFFSDSITGHLSELMFGKKLPTATWLNGSFTTAPELIWPLYMQMKASFPHMLITAKSHNSTYPSQESYLEQISIIRKNADLQGSCKKSKLIGKFEGKIKEFLDKDSSHFKYNTYGERFEPANEEMSKKYNTLLSYDGLYSVIMNLGPQAGFCINKIIVTSIAQSMIKIFKIHDSLLQVVGEWWIKFRQKNNSWILDAVKTPQIKEAADEMVKLGSSLQLRYFIRKVLHDVISKSAPGLVELISTSLIKDNGEHISEKQDFLAEMVSGLPTFHFIKIAIDKEELLKTSNCQQFYFFLALLLLNPSWNNIKFINDLEAFTYNLHLIPVALDAFLATNGSFVQANDSRKAEEGLITYFDTLAQVINYKRNAPDATELLGESLVILADLFPKSISRLQYGTVAKSFPANVVFDAYHKFDPNLSPIDKIPIKKKQNKK